MRLRGCLKISVAGEHQVFSVDRGERRWNGGGRGGGRKKKREMEEDVENRRVKELGRYGEGGYGGDGEEECLGGKEERDINRS